MKNPTWFKLWDPIVTQWLSEKNPWTNTKQDTLHTFYERVKRIEYIDVTAQWKINGYEKYRAPTVEELSDFFS